MIRRVAPVFGTLLLVLVAVFLAFFGGAVLADPVTLLLVSGLVCAAILEIVGGRVDAVSVGSATIPWHVLIGVSYVVIAGTLVLSFLRTALGPGTSVDWIVLVGVALGSTSLTWFGVQVARDSRHVDLDATPSTTRTIVVALLVVGSIAGGIVLTAIV